MAGGRYSNIQPPKCRNIGIFLSTPKAIPREKCQLLTGEKDKHMRYRCIMIRRICSFLFITKSAAVMLLASILPAHASPIWECKSGGGWSMKSDGSMTEIPASEDTVILEFQSPNKMRPVKASSAFEQKIYDEMTWEQVGDKFYGQPLIRDGSNIFTVSEVLSETGSVMTMIFRDGDVRTAIGRNVCKKTVSAVANKSVRLILAMGSSKMVLLR